MAKSIIIAFLALGSVLAAPTTSSTPIPPSQDPWYKAPWDFEWAKPGQLLRIRRAPGEVISAANASDAYNILYRTTNSFDAPSWAVTTLFIPSTPKQYEANGKESPALMSYQIPYDTPNVDYSPSYALRFANSSGISDIAQSLALGLFVNVPDFEGPSAAFSAGVLAGYSVLDSIRAAQSAGKGPQSDSSVVLWGFSAASQASEFAGEFHQKYAPEIQIKGAALGGTIVNFSDVLQAINDTPLSGILPNSILGFAAEYPDVKKHLESTLKKTGPQNATAFFAAEKNSFDESVAELGDINFYDYFTNGKADLIDAPVMQNAFKRDGVMGTHGMPDFPLFIYTAIHDEVQPINDTQALVTKYCAAGADLLWEKNTVGGHVAEEENGDARAFAWLTGILDGSLGDCETKGCVIKDVTLNLTSSPI